MTENEKLRALLAEAREALRPLSLSADGFAQMRQRIDAALAEPVDFLMPTTDAKEVRWEMVQMLKRERDEARAEVERLRDALLTIERSGAPGASIFAKRNDGHACSWCRGVWTPCPTSAAAHALAGKEKP